MSQRRAELGPICGSVPLPPPPTVKVRVVRGAKREARMAVHPPAQADD